MWHDSVSLERCLCMHANVELIIQCPILWYSAPRRASINAVALVRSRANATVTQLAASPGHHPYGSFCRHRFRCPCRRRGRGRRLLRASHVRTWRCCYRRRCCGQRQRCCPCRRGHQPHSCLRCRSWRCAHRCRCPCHRRRRSSSSSCCRPCLHSHCPPCRLGSGCGPGPGHHPWQAGWDCCSCRPRCCRGCWWCWWWCDRCCLCRRCCWGLARGCWLLPPPAFCCSQKIRSS